MTLSVSISDLIGDPDLLGDFHTGPSWARWRGVLRAAYGLAMSERDLELFDRIAGGRVPPKKRVEGTGLRRRPRCRQRQHCG